MCHKKRSKGALKDESGLATLDLPIKQNEISKYNETTHYWWPRVFLSDPIGPFTKSTTTTST